MVEQNLLAPEEKEFATFYKRSLFWVTHRQAIKHVALGAFLLMDVLMLGRTAYAFLDFGVINYFNERAMVGSIVDGVGHFHTVSTAHAASGLKVSDTAVFALDAKRADFYAEITNPNADWEVAFDYTFTYDDASTPVQQGFLLPNTLQKPLTALGVVVDSIPRSAALQVSNVVWTRVNHHAIPDYAAWRDERLNVVFTNVAYANAVVVGSSTIGKTTFTVENASAYGFWNPVFTVVLYRNDNPVGVTTVTVPTLAGGETRDVTVNWFGIVPQANATLIIPNIDIFDPAVFMPLHGELVPDVRERIQIKR